MMQFNSGLIRRIPAGLPSVTMLRFHRPITIDFTMLNRLRLLRRLEISDGNFSNSASLLTTPLLHLFLHSYDPASVERMLPLPPRKRILYLVAPLAVVNMTALMRNYTRLLGLNLGNNVP